MRNKFHLQYDTHAPKESFPDRKDQTRQIKEYFCPARAAVLPLPTDDIYSVLRK